MIRYYYSSTGEYRQEDVIDYQESIIFDGHNNKLRLFGNNEFYFQKLSTVYKTKETDASLAASQNSVNDMYVELNTSIYDISTKLNDSVLKLNTANTSIYNVSTAFDSYKATNDLYVNDISTRLKTANTSIYDISTRLNSLTTYTSNTSTRLNDVSIKTATMSNNIKTNYDIINTVSAYTVDVSTRFNTYKIMTDSSVLNISTRLKTISDNLSTEITNRTNSDNTLQTNINNVNSSISDISTRVESKLNKTDYIAPDVNKNYVDDISARLNTNTEKLISVNSSISDISTRINTKQDILVSGSNIKTINNLSLLGTGNIDITSGGTGTTYTAGKEINISSDNIISYSLADFISKGAGDESLLFNDISTNYASGKYSHAEGYDVSAIGDYSHAEGEYTITQNYSEHASGQYNLSHTDISKTFGLSGNTLFSVGYGLSEADRKNAFEIMQDGSIYIAGINERLRDYIVNTSNNLNNYILTNDSSVGDISTRINEVSTNLNILKSYSENTSTRFNDYMISTDSSVRDISTRINEVSTNLNILKSYSENTSTKLNDYIISNNSSIYEVSTRIKDVSTTLNTSILSLQTELRSATTNNVFKTVEDGFYVTDSSGYSIFSVTPSNGIDFVSLSSHAKTVLQNASFMTYTVVKEM